MTDDGTRSGRVRPVAPPVTPDTRGWWDATRDRQLTVQRCATCGRAQLYPRARCVGCHGDDLALVDAAGTGTVSSFTVVHRSPDPAVFAPPYVVALVRLDEGPLVTTNLVDVPDGELRCELAVRVVWEPLPDGRHLPLFTRRSP